MASQEETAGFKHLEGLKEGDALRLRMSYSVKRPVVGETVFVYRVIDGLVVEGLGEGSRTRRYDFTALVKDGDGELMEFPYDSRYFERVA